jgi:uncharacterized protein (TIGR00369 family)
MLSKKLEFVKLLFEQIIPFNRHLGMELEHLETGLVAIRVPFQPHFIGNPELPALHGGVVSAVLDTAGGASVWSSIEAHDRVSTVDLRVDYLRPGRAEPLIGQGRVVRLGNRVGVAELRAFHPGAEDKPIAAGMGVYNVRRAPEGSADDLWDRVARHAGPADQADPPTGSGSGSGSDTDREPGNS